MDLLDSQLPTLAHEDSQTFPPLRTFPLKTPFYIDIINNNCIFQLTKIYEEKHFWNGIHTHTICFFLRDLVYVPHRNLRDSQYNSKKLVLRLGET